MTRRKPRFTVFYPHTGRYAQNPAGESGLGWTHDRAEADALARDFDGVVVDTDDFSQHWWMYVQIAALGGVMPRKRALQILPKEFLS